MRVSLRSSWVRSVRAAVRIFASLSRFDVRMDLKLALLEQCLLLATQTRIRDMLTKPMMMLRCCSCLTCRPAQ